LDRLLGDRRGLVALDAGVGRGDVTQPVYDRSDDLTLLDRESSYEALWRERFPRARRVVGNIEDATLGRYDWITFSHGLYYHATTRWEPLCRRLFESLRPGGVLCVVMNRDMGDWWAIVRRFYGQPDWNCQFHYMPWSQFRTTVLSWGTVRSETMACTLTFPEMHHLINYTAEACLSLAHPRPQNAHERIREAYLAMGWEPSGPLTLRYEAEILCLQRPS